MSNENEKVPQGEDSTAVDANLGPDTSGSDEGEFKLKIRKLEMPVRPRGVLAE